MCGAVFLVGLLLRLWILWNAPLNADEATAGLVAHQIIHGHTYAFYWGQRYGGVETYFTALNFLIFGQSPFVLNATPAILALVASVLVWRIGIRLFDPAPAVVAAVLSWIWCESSLWNSTRATGFHEVALVLGLILLLQSLRIVQRARHQGSDLLKDWAILGTAGGLGFWASPGNCLLRRSITSDGCYRLTTSVSRGGTKAAGNRRGYCLRRSAAMDLVRRDWWRQRSSTLDRVLSLATRHVFNSRIANGSGPES